MEWDVATFVSWTGAEHTYLSFVRLLLPARRHVSVIYRLSAPDWAGPLIGRFESSGRQFATTVAAKLRPNLGGGIQHRPNHSSRLAIPGLPSIDPLKRWPVRLMSL